MTASITDFQRNFRDAREAAERSRAINDELRAWVLLRRRKDVAR